MNSPNIDVTSLQEACNYSNDENYSSDEETYINNSTSSSSASDVENYVENDESCNIASINYGTHSNSSVDSIQIKLARWAISSNQTRNDVNQLLNILHELDPTLPKDRRSLCRTPRKSLSIYKMGDSHYFHVGLDKCLNHFFAMHPDHQFNKNLQIDVNIDGLPIAKSSSSVLWPILVNVVKFNYVLLVGAYYGLTKPANINKFIEMFVTELEALIESGFIINEKQYFIKVRMVIADAPARAFLLHVRSHTGYSSCCKCKIKGVYALHRVTFPNIQNVPRTDREFRQKLDINYHLDSSPTFIERVLDNCVDDVAIDPMHAVYEGVTKQLLVQWITIRNKSYSLSKNAIDTISNLIMHISPQLSSDFARKTRPLNYLSRYKATELRQLCLYTLPVILKSALNVETYNHFLLYHCAIRILNSVHLCLIRNGDARDFIISFIDTFDNFYDAHQFSYNLHSLLHISEDVLHFQEPLDEYSAFKFENFLQFLKHICNSKSNILNELSNKYLERINFNVPFNFQTLHLNNADKLSDGSYKKIYFNGSSFSCKAPDNYCFLLNKKKFIKITKIIQLPCMKKIIYGRRIMNQLLPVYNYPLDSRELGIFKSNNELILDSEFGIEIDTNYIIKSTMFEVDSTYYLLTLLH